MVVDKDYILYNEQLWHYLSNHVYSPKLKILGKNFTPNRSYISEPLKLVGFHCIRLCEVIIITDVNMFPLLQIYTSLPFDL